MPAVWNQRCQETRSWKHGLPTDISREE